MFSWSFIKSAAASMLCTAMVLTSFALFICLWVCNMTFFYKWPQLFRGMGDKNEWKSKSLICRMRRRHIITGTYTESPQTVNTCKTSSKYTLDDTNVVISYITLLLREGWTCFLLCFELLAMQTDCNIVTARVFIDCLWQDA